jgi:phenylpropionate dioxygenase-like ring-hydroxylating dioxygenase large terminal subunit
MFVHQSQLEHLLTPEHYRSELYYQTELKQLFVPGWHCVATRADLPRRGDFLTIDLFGHPLQLRNIDGTIHAFLNVCAHRHCLLTHEARGSDPHFRCQYHGWEYTAEGKTARIPEAACFRPFDRQNARLRKYRSDCCGELVFVSLADDGTSLREYLGPFYTTCCEYFAFPYRQSWKCQFDYAANWKVVVENSLESYHIPCLHAKTFGSPPPEETCQHDLSETYTTFRTPEPPGFITKIQRWIVRRMGITPTSMYLHHHAHPNLIFTSLDVHRMAQVVIPTSPSTCRHLVWLYTIRGPRRGLLARWLGWNMSWVVTKIAKQIVLEDFPIFADVQRGLNASVHRGVIGTREERVYVFQDYVARACANPNGSDSQPGTSTRPPTYLDY